MADQETIRIRLYHADDRGEVMAIAPRLTEGIAAWRDARASASAVLGWVSDSLDAAGQPGHAAYVAVGGDGISGFVTVGERTHFTGQVDAYVGELAVRAGLERRGIAARLMAAAEAWASGRGLAHLTLETGAANEPARQLYRALGYLPEEVRLTKVIGAAFRAAPRDTRLPPSQDVATLETDA